MTSRILYCHCAYAQVVPKAVKQDVLRALTDSDVDFDAVADLCEMSARRDPALASMVSMPAGGDLTGNLTIVACYPRAVKWLFHAAGTPLPEEGVRVLNMRTDTAAQVVAALPGVTTEEGA